MFKVFSRAIVMLMLLGSFSACSSRSTGAGRAFYYWKTGNYSLDRAELGYLRDQKIQKLYVKFFDVSTDPVLGPVPLSKTDLHIWDYEYSYESDSIFRDEMTHLEIIPVVYLKNEVFLNVTHGCLDTLADNITFLVSKYYNNMGNRERPDFREIQLDCDWTSKTSGNYFYLLRKMKEASRKTISCTLRLYPYKYREKTGVPPADRAVLMCYNLLSPMANDDKNSILDNHELESYLEHAGKYPVPLDVALPVFSWMEVFQNNQFAGIIHPKAHELDSILRPLKPFWYEVTADRELDKLYLRAGDKVKAESVTAETIRGATALLKKYLPADSSRTVILFSLDNDYLSGFDHETLSGFFSDFIH